MGDGTTDKVVACTCCVNREEVAFTGCCYGQSLCSNGSINHHLPPLSCDKESKEEEGMHEEVLQTEANGTEGDKNPFSHVGSDPTGLLCAYRLVRSG